jgi:hypothetical protein
MGKLWLRSSQDCEQRGLIVGGDQGSRQGHQCSETSLTGEPDFFASVGASPGLEPMPPQAGSKQLTHWTSETVYWISAAGLPHHELVFLSVEYFLVFVLFCAG